MDWAEEKAREIVADFWGRPPEQLSDGDEEVANIATALRQAHARGIEEAARAADEYANVNIEMAQATILGDPVLSGRDRSREGWEKSGEMTVDGTIHSAAFHAAQNIAKNIRALKDGGTDG